jgi:hypothetical protein
LAKLQILALHILYIIDYRISNQLVKDIKFLIQFSFEIVSVSCEVTLLNSHSSVSLFSMMEVVHCRFLTVLKMFGLNSAKSENERNKLLVLYNVILIIIYAIILYFRFDNVVLTSLNWIKNTVVDLQMAIQVITFLSNVIANWLHSKTFYKCFQNLKPLDETLANFGFKHNYRRVNTIFSISFFVTFGFIVYVTICNYVSDVIVYERVSICNWLSVYFVVTINYFSCYCMVIFLWFLILRYKLLVRFLKRIVKSKTPAIYSNVEDLTVIKIFTNLFTTLNKISKFMISSFSLQICTMFLFTSISITNNLYLLLKEEFYSLKYLTVVNVFCMNLIELLAVIIAHYQLYLQVCLFII